MPSRFIVAARRVPQQRRGQKRVSALLGAASEVLADRGYEAATMSEIAERANACIGSLYQFFPNKESIGCALHIQCGEEIEQRWAPLLAQTTPGGLDDLFDRLIDVTVDYIDTHPVLVALQQAQKSHWNEKLRKRLERQIARFYLARTRKLDKSTADIYAAVSMQIIRSCGQHYLQAPRKKRKRIVDEYKFLLRCYGSSRQNSQAIR